MSGISGMQILDNNDLRVRARKKQLVQLRRDVLEKQLKEIKKLISDQLERDSSFYDKYADAPLIGLALKNAYIRKFPCVDK